ncbi:MAG: class I SAM-dependent methyltransferase [Bacteroidales bacterium]|nr:class I SAM-dependent methyltransferase [Bacteroidales bacterium]
MESYQYRQMDFDNPSLIEKLAHGVVIPIFGSRFFYAPFYRKLSLKGNERVLDFGCGPGTGSKYILSSLDDENGALICLDTSPYWLEQARKRLGKYNNVRFHNEDIREANIAEGSIDAVSIMYVLHDIPPLEREPIVNVIGKTLRPNGRLIIWEPTKLTHGMPPEEIKSLMNKAGLNQLWQKPKKNSWQGGFIKK